MAKITERYIADFISDRMPSFHEHRLASLSSLQLKRVLKRKNPYLFRAKDVTTAPDLVKGVLDAHLSSQEETLFGSVLEELAVFVCARVYAGRKSPADGVDLEFERDGIIYIVSVKSGPNWENSSQIKKMVENFRKARRILGTNTSRKNIVAINGCCYGKNAQEDKEDYLKLCGEKFWSFVSGMPRLYLDIIGPMGHRARERNELFHVEYAKVINRFTKEFIEDFCEKDGAILWEKLVRFNSGAD